jgi:hypothetical protein
MLSLVLPVNVTVGAVPLDVSYGLGQLLTCVGTHHRVCHSLVSVVTVLSGVGVVRPVKLPEAASNVPTLTVTCGAGMGNGSSYDLIGR